MTTYTKVGSCSIFLMGVYTREKAWWRKGKEVDKGGGILRRAATNYVRVESGQLAPAKETETSRTSNRNPESKKKGKRGRPLNEPGKCREGGSPAERFTGKGKTAA